MVGFHIYLHLWLESVFDRNELLIQRSTKVEDNNHSASPYQCCSDVATRGFVETEERNLQILLIKPRDA